MQKTLLGLCGAVLAVLFASMMLAVARRRADPGGPPAFQASTKMDYLWAAIPWLIIIASIIPAARRILAGS